MSKDKGIIKAFTGPEIAVILLKNILEDNGIGCSIKNNFQSGLSAGFFGGSPSSIDLYVQKTEIEKAKPLIEEFLNNNKEELT